MAGTCPNAFCYFGDGGGCHQGLHDVGDCLDFASQGGIEADEPAEAAVDAGGYAVAPWSASAMGEADLPFVAARSVPKVVAIAGPHNAGKTTLLAAIYLQLGAGSAAAGHQFAGSYSLDGWEAVAHCLRWTHENPPTFPAHTPLGVRRDPGLLHLAFRGDNATLSDLFFADAPGEWFNQWAHDSKAVDAEGARWVAGRASLFLITADCEALAGPERGNARKLLRFLAERIAEARDGRPVALAWTKADMTPDPAMATAVRDSVRAALPDLVEFHVTVAPEGDDPGFMPLLEWMLAQVNAQATPSPRRTMTDHFLDYRA